MAVVANKNLPFFLRHSPVIVCVYVPHQCMCTNVYGPCTFMYMLCAWPQRLLFIDCGILECLYLSLASALVCQTCSQCCTHKVWDNIKCPKVRTYVVVVLVHSVSFFGHDCHARQLVGTMHNVVSVIYVCVLTSRLVS